MKASHVLQIALASACALLGSAGCTLAPRYARPAAPVPAAWSGAGESAARSSGNPVDRLEWSAYFADARLRRLIELALEHNRDLRVSTLNVAQLRAQYRIQRAALVPALDAEGSASRSRTPASQTGTGSASISTQYSAGVGATAWELDLFGRVRSLKDQALETYFAAEETRRSAQLALIAEVATQYLGERALAEQLTLARETLAAVARSRDLTRRTHELGGASALDAESAEAQVRSAEASVASYERQHAAAEHALVLVIGTALPADFPAPRPLAEIAFVGGLPAGLPSDLLVNRPDIRAAEHALKAANASIGAARAAFLPKIALTASAGSESAELSGLFSGGTGTWSFVPQITLPLFAAGSNRASLDNAKLAQQIEVATYEKAIQTAFTEVADVLSAQAPLERQLAAQTALVGAQQRRHALAEARYRQGADSYLAVLTAQQDLYSAQQTLIATRLAHLDNMVTFYKVLGGGMLSPGASE